MKKIFPANRAKSKGNYHLQNENVNTMKGV